MMRFSRGCRAFSSHGPTPDRVRSYELFKVAPRWLFLRMETEGGVVGWGEPNVEGFSDSVATAVGELMSSVVGQDPSRINYIWQKLRRQRFYATAGGRCGGSANRTRSSSSTTTSPSIYVLYTSFELWSPSSLCQGRC